MGSVSGEMSEWDGSDSGAREDKIFVSVRLRPLNERELTTNDIPEWDCINNSTIIFKNSFQERSTSPTAYTFDRVFASDCPTRQVYEDSAKKIVLSVLSGINSTIFAYGQTSSGKTYTMSGITDYAIQDMYNYIDKHRERDFVMKFSAMEIYNEAVKDLLSPDATQLRLLDDPERGTVVEKLTEVVVRDSNHLKELLSICETQRQTGETTLNELSSRSHQILRLTVESEAHAYFGAENMSTLTASVNFVDLAGSERASQTMSAGARLKEGCHINRSLLTLGTVIRKLSKGRNGHVPYRNSKLTRILQNSLGGNAKTAIICTMSPARSHVEQSRNTLLFASCAKQVSTNAQVNVVMSEKALVKHLQKELARLENELRSMRNISLQAASGDSSAALKEKELLISKMDKEIRELTLQRDLAQSHMENMLHAGRECQEPKNWIYMNSLDKASWGSEYSASETSEIIMDPLRSDTASCVSHYSDRHERVNSIENDDALMENNEEQFLADATSPTLYIDKYFGPDPCQGWEKGDQEIPKNSEDNSKEVQCIEEVHYSGSDTLSSMSPSEKEDHTPGHSPCSSIEDLSDTEINVLRSKSCKAILTTAVESSKTKIENENNVEKETESTLDEEPAVIEREVSSVAPVEDGEIPCAKDTETSVKESSVHETEKGIKTMDRDCMSNKQETNVTEQNEVIQPNAAIQIKDNLEPEDAKTSNNLERIENDGYDNSHDVKQPALEIVSNETKISNGPESTANECFDNAQDIKQPALAIVSNDGPDEAQDSKQYATDGLDEAQDSKQYVTDRADEAQDSKQYATGGPDEAQDSKKYATDRPDEAQDSKQYATNRPDEAQDSKQYATEKALNDCASVEDARDIKETTSEKSADCAAVNEAQHEKQPALEKAADDSFDEAEQAQNITESALEKIIDCTTIDEAQHEKQPAPEKPVDDGLDKVEDTKKSAEYVIDKSDQVTKPVQKMADNNFDRALETKPAASDWSVEFERQKREIIELWDACNIPLVHRTYFSLLFQGDPSDAVYVEVELRRLSFLKNTLHGPTLVKDAQLTDLASSLKALNREREMLSKQMMKKLTTKEREAMYEKWGIDLKSKQRRFQLCRRLFTDATDMEHIKESASIVAKLVGFKKPGQAPKAMVGLSFSQKPAANFRSFSWRRNSMI